MRHTFAVHRLTRWYRAGVNLHARLPLLAVYLGHESLLGTEVYLTAAPGLLALAGQRFAARVFAVRSSMSRAREASLPRVLLPRPPRARAWGQPTYAARAGFGPS